MNPSKKIKLKQTSPKIELPQKREMNPNYFLFFILLLTTIVFFNSFANDFTNWDDTVYVTKNELIKNWSVDGIKQMFSSFYGSNYHPLTGVSNALEYHFFGLNPKVYHIDNLILHLLNVFLVFVFIKKLNSKTEIALIVALFFGIHPMHVESVSWIAERKDVLYSFFFLLSLIFYLDWNNEKRNLKYVLSIAFFILALLSKSAAVTLFPLLICIDFYSGKLKKISWDTLLKYIPFFLLALAFGIIAMLSQGEAIEATTKFNYFDRIFLASYGVMYYLFNFFVPIHLSALHPYPVKVGNFLPNQYYASFIVILMLFIAILKSRKHKKELLFGMVFFLITIILTLQLFPVGYAIVAERYTYIPYIGWLFAVASIGVETYKTNAQNGLVTKILLLVLLVFILCFSVTTFQRNKVWKNSITLWTDVISKEKSAIAHNNRGTAEDELKMYSESENDYSQAIKINSNYYEAYNNRGFARKNLHKYSEALADYDFFLNVNSTYYLALFNRAEVKNELKNYKGAIDDYSQAILLHPNYSSAYSNRAVAKGILGNLQGAISDLSEAIKLDPKNSSAINNRGNAKLILKDFSGAISDFSQAININPAFADSYYNRAIAYLNLNNITNACSDFKKAIELGNIENAKKMLDKYCN